MFTPEDAFLMDYAQKLVYNSDSKITVMDSNNHMGGHFVMESAVESLQTKYPANISLKTDKIMKREFLDRQDLMIISLESWKKLVDSQSVWLSNVPSVLIIKP
jgi:hypothetical protein